ncbi:hypothetical protein T484DRAFT_1648855, partial [Baffinella frigidus]
TYTHLDTDTHLPTPIPIYRHRYPSTDTYIHLPTPIPIHLSIYIPIYRSIYLLTFLSLYIDPRRHLSVSIHTFISRVTI